MDSGLCIGSGSCAGIAPRHFRLADDRSTPILTPVAPADEVLAAAGSCPAEAISVHDAATGEPLS